LETGLLLEDLWYKPTGYIATKYLQLYITSQSAIAVGQSRPILFSISANQRSEIDIDQL